MFVPGCCILGPRFNEIEPIFNRNNMSETTLLIFIKNPEKGKAKTRLAQGVGEERALQIYQALLGHTRKVAQGVKAKRLLFYSSFIDEQDEWTADDFEKRLQEGDDLGERMQLAFAEGFRKGGPVVIIGSDCAQLTSELVEEAIDHLQRHDFVIGPAEDGGYYLLGMRTFMPAVFEGINWSTAEVFSTTLQRLGAHNWSYELLPVLSDIDFEEDWEKYGWELD